MRIFYLGLLIVCGYHALACSCIGKGRFDIQFKESDVVFSGKVIRLDTVLYADSTPVYFPGKVEHSIHRYARIKAVFQIEERFKGVAKSGNFVAVFTEVESNRCGFLFEVDKDYVVYCKSQDKIFNSEPKRKNSFTPISASEPNGALLKNLHSFITDDCYTTEIKERTFPIPSPPDYTAKIFTFSGNAGQAKLSVFLIGDLQGY